MKDRTQQPTTSKQSRVTRRRARVRADLLAAAQQVFTTRGYQDATIAEIAQTADVAIGTFYLHFREKEELLLALAEEVQQTLHQQIQTAIAKEPNAPLIPLTIRTLLRMAYEQRDLFLLVCAGEAHLVTHVQAQRAQQGLSELFVAAFPESLDASYDPALLAQLIVGMLIWAINWWFEHDEPGPEVMAEHILFTLPSLLLQQEQQETIEKGDTNDV